MIIGWRATGDDGGCSIIGYKLLRDDGAGGSINIEVDPTNIENKPYLTSYEVEFTAADIGNNYRFEITVINILGEKTSNAAAFILATVPDKPVVVP